MWFCFREIRLHIVVHHSKRHFHGNLTAGKFGISGQRETSACPWAEKRARFSAGSLNGTILPSMFCEYPDALSGRSFSASSLSSSSAGIHTARQGVPHPCRSGTAAYRVRPSSFKTCGAPGIRAVFFSAFKMGISVSAVCNFDKRMYARILTCVGIMTHVRRTFLPIPSMGDPEHTHPDSESRCSIISIVTFSGGSSSTCRDRSCRIWGSAAVPLIAALTDNHASLSSSIGLS